MFSTDNPLRNSVTERTLLKKPIMLFTQRKQMVYLCYRYSAILFLKSQCNICKTYIE